jgi:hypothetical protein
MAWLLPSDGSLIDGHPYSRDRCELDYANGYINVLRRRTTTEKQFTLDGPCAVKKEHREEKEKEEEEEREDKHTHL